MGFKHMPERIIKHGQEIWDAHEYKDWISWRNHSIRKHTEKRLMQLPLRKGCRISALEPIIPRDKPSYLMRADNASAPSHVMAIQFVYYDSEPLLAGMIPIINVCFSHVFKGFDFYAGNESQLRHGHVFFRARIVNQPKPHIIGEHETWGLRSGGRLIWCNESTNSIDKAGWCFSVPMTTVQTPDEVDELLIKPIHALLQGINPNDEEIPFSPYTLQFQIKGNDWGLAD